MNRLLPDLRFAFRTLLKSPGFTLVALLTLSLAIGANTAIFSFVNAVLLSPLPYRDADRMVRVWEAPPNGGRNSISTLNFLDWQKEGTCFEHLSARTGGSVALTGRGEPVQIPGVTVSACYFEIFGIRPALGRTFRAGEDEEGTNKVAVIAHSLWQTQFGGDPNIVDQVVHFGGVPHTIIGVLPADCPFERGSSRVWRPLAFNPGSKTRNFHWLQAVGKLKEGVSVAQARAQMDALGTRIAADFPDSNKGWGVAIEPYASTIVGPELRESLWVLLGAVAMVLLIACANLANLSLLRVVGREREIAVRIALGAGRPALLRQFLSESLLLSIVGGALGLAVAHGMMAGLKATMPGNALPAEAVVALDWRVLVFSFGLILLTGLGIGLLPAWQAARANLTPSLKQGAGGASRGASHARVRSGLVVAEIALAFVLLAGAGLLIRSLSKLSHIDPGFDATNVLTCRLPVSEKNYADAEALNTYVREVRRRVGELPGVTEVATTTALPLQGWGYGMPMQIADQPAVDRANRKAVFFKMVSPSYFPALRIRLQRGRLLSDTDRTGAPQVAVINETLAKRYFPDRDPIGKRLLIQEIFPGKAALGDEIAWEIVGVVANETVGRLSDDAQNHPGMYVSQEQSPSYGLSLLVRGATDSNLLREAVKQAVYAVNRDQMLPEMKTLETIRADSLGNTEFRTMLLAAFAGVSLLLSAIGIYGVISFSVSQRTREIGIRAALGAGRGDIVRLVLRHGLVLAAIGLVVGIGGAVGVTRLLGSFLFGVTGYDPLTFATVAVALGGVAVLACVLPARRAAKVDPLIALKCE